MPRKAKVTKKQRRALNKKPAFLKALALTGSITEAARAVKVDRSKHYDWMRDDPAYPARYATAKAMGEDALEDEAVYRARVGVYEPLVFKGQFSFPQERFEVVPEEPAKDWKDEGGEKPPVPPVYAWRDVPGAPPLGVWRKSDNLLMFLLRGAKAKYRAANVELTGAGGGPVEQSITVRFVKAAE